MAEVSPFSDGCLEFGFLADVSPLQWVRMKLWRLSILKLPLILLFLFDSPNPRIWLCLNDFICPNSGPRLHSPAIMCPQSSGKCTLLNHLFGTKFREMDAYEGRSTENQGIWMGKCAAIGSFTIAMDLEGTDGSERGEEAGKPRNNWFPY